MNLTISHLLSAAAIFAMGGSAFGATPAVSVSGRYAKQFYTASPKLVTLYDQNNDDSGNAVNSQNYESSLDIYDDQAADDFIVPKGANWTILEVDVTGQYNTGGPAASENVFFYADAGGLPGQRLAECDNLAGKDNGSGSFAISLKKCKVKLKKGHYWLSVQVNLDSGTGGEWYWENSTDFHNDPPAWQNPGDGFGTGCTTWADEFQCTGVPGHRPPDGGPDHMYTLKGKTGN